MKKIFLPCLCLLLSACTHHTMDIGQGFESDALHAPWDSLDNGTRFSCHNTADRFFFNFDVIDSSLTLYRDDNGCGEKIVDKGDRVEIFLCPNIKGKGAAAYLKDGYYCAEIDPEGRVMDYKAGFYRDFDFNWDFRSIHTRAELTPWGYRVAGSISRSELEELGFNLEGAFTMGVFQGDFHEDGNVNWYSLIPTEDKEPDFHKPGVLFPCKMNPKEEKRGVVVYPNDITSLGLAEWEARIRQSGINLIGLHAATVNDPIDTLEAFVKSRTGQDFLKMCGQMGVDVEYELHALQTILPRSLFESHPEYFREDADGVRQQQYNMCFSNSDAVEAIRPELEKLLEWMKPTTHRYFFWTDDKQDKFCHCELCREFSDSEQALMYENRLLSLLREYDPKATLAHLAYHQTLEHPVKVRASEGIFLEYAPIHRDYSQTLPDEHTEALNGNLLCFPAATLHILEYWLDESMFSRWKRDQLVPLPFKQEECSRDVNSYRRLGATDMTCFATWLYGDYVRQYGSTESIFTSYGDSFRE